MKNADRTNDVLLGKSGDRFTYWGEPSGWVRVEGNPAIGTKDSEFGSRDYWRLSRTLPGFMDGTELTDAGRTW
jgi:hypothetical protein